MMIRKIANRLLSRQAGPLLLLLTLLLFVLSACASNSGIFAGGSWQASGLQNQHLQVLAVDPNHLQHIYAGDTQSGVFVSTDAGLSWKQSSVGLPLSTAISALSFDIPGKKLYAATAAGLFVSSDAAATWSMVTNLPSDSYTVLTFDVNAPQTIYTGTAHSGVFKSTDGGVHWASISSGLPASTLTSLLYDSNQKQLWAAFADRVYRLDDNGANWHLMSNGLPANVGINTLALGGFTLNTNLIFAGTEHGFYLSTDAGQHWAQSQSPLANLHISVVLPDATQPKVVYIASQIGVLRSQDNGQNWDRLAVGIPINQPITSLVQGNANNAQLFATSHGIYFYPGGGGASNPAQFIPILLVVFFFGLMYWFFVARPRKRRRMVSWQATQLEETNGQDTPGSDEKEL